MQLQLKHPTDSAYSDKLVSLLSGDLDFHDEDSSYASHNFHSFPAKFPPQLPRAFLLGLTEPGAAVLDPMMGSGTTIVESFLAGRYGIGFDIDPLAQLVTKVKVTPVDVETTAFLGNKVIEQARLKVENEASHLEAALNSRWDESTREFVDDWFSHPVQVELIALITAVEEVQDEAIQEFLKLAFSSTIITKSGGVSLALDLGHTRPHKAKTVLDLQGNIIRGQELSNGSARHPEFSTKRLRSPISEFQKRLFRNLEGVQLPHPERLAPSINRADAQHLPLAASSVDLIITSPPYASNAIDYMRAHKFSLIWLGYSINDLGAKKREYIGSEYTSKTVFEELPQATRMIIDTIANKDKKKGLVVERYYSEMKRVLEEMLRVLKPGKAAIVVVGNSTLKGTDIKIYSCLADIGEAIGFTVPKIGVRNLDRNRRMLPAGNRVNLASQIQQRMHEEYVIAFLKP